MKFFNNQIYNRSLRFPSMERIAIIGDSNSTSYLENDDNLTPMNYLYSYHLAQYGYEVIPMAFVSNNTRKIINRSRFFLKNANSKYFIVQIGWIDSTPKLYPNWVNFLVSLQLKGTKKIIQKIVSHYKNYYKKNYQSSIPIEEFRINLSKIIGIIRKYNLNSKIIFLTIPYSTENQINLFRKKFNVVLIEEAKKSKCDVIDTYELTKNKNMLNETEHFSNEAHKKIAVLIKNKLDSI